MQELMSKMGPLFYHFFTKSCHVKNLLMPLFLMGCFPVDFQEAKRPLRTKSVKRPIKVGKRPINEGKRPIKAKVLVGVSVGCLMGCFTAPPPWRKTAPLKRPIKRSMIIFDWDLSFNTSISATDPPLFLGVDACRDPGEGQF